VAAAAQWGSNTGKPGVVRQGIAATQHSKSMIAAVKSEHGLPTQTAAMLRSD